MHVLERGTLVLAFSVYAVAAGAQCPDGSPPPCRSQTVVAAPRRVNPPLDDRTWIVVPFDNLANNADIEWLRSASVNLLYLDMSRWRDIRVVDDERVADLIREVPEASGSTKSLSLNAGLAVAKRAGAGRLVMGDVLKLGNRTAVTAKVFDVKTGQRVRSIREETSLADSVISIFPKLAQKVLNVAPPQGANLGALGTTRVDAYQEYIAGVEALNKFELKDARRRLERAIALDSAFALAHYKLSIVGGWDQLQGGGQKEHAEAAARLAGGLPPRERGLINGQLASVHGEWTRACEFYSGLLSSDSTDIEARYGVGECKFHDLRVDPLGGDTSKMRFRGNYNASIRAFQRVLELDPEYHLAYQHIVDALTSDRQPQSCYMPDASAQRCSAFYSAFLIRSGDTLIVDAAGVTDTSKMRQQAEAYNATRSRRRNLVIAAATATAWVQNSPNEPSAHRALGRVLLLQGRLPEAEAELKRIRPGTLSLLQELSMILERMEIAYKLGRGAEAIRLYDSLRTANIPVPNGATTIQLGNAIAGFGPAFGRMTEFDSLVVLSMRAAPPAVALYQRLAIRAAFAGIRSDSLPAAERALFDQVSASRGATVATRTIGTTLSYAMRVPRLSWPPVDTTVRDRKLGPGIALARGDTTKLRAAARMLDSAVANVVATGSSDSAFALVAADAYIALRDSAAALRVLRLALDSAMVTTPLFPLQNAQGNVLYFLPRMMLARADLAAALGQKEEARIWYKRFVDIWATATPELQTSVERARKSLAALGP